MKKFSLFLLLLILIGSLSGCSESYPQVEVESTSLVEETTPEYVTESYPHMIIGISVGEDGYYSLMSDAVIGYYKGEMTSIEIDDPALLAFRVSSDRGGGVYIVDKPDGDAMIEDLTDLAEKLKELGREDLVAEVSRILDILNQSGPITSAST